MHKHTHESQLPGKTDWQGILAQAVRDPQQLLQRLGLADSSLARQISHERKFITLVPQTFVARMQPGNSQDPLLRQVLPLLDEEQDAAGYSQDPLGEQASNLRPGLIHKYHGRVLLIAAGGCAINCRYCFRRHFPYADNRVSREQWRTALDYVAQDSSISEVILSGGDPLLLADTQLQELLTQIEGIAHVKRLRIHSRLPVVIAQRLTPALRDMLAQSRLRTSIVLHVNHAQELGAEHRVLLAGYRTSGIALLNQSVLLAGVNDRAETLCQLSETLFDYGVLPYYLHQLDQVQGAQHFAVEEQRALAIYRQMLASLPGYLVPRLVREEAGKPSKTPVSVL